jgi:hypothetical protein
VNVSYAPLHLLPWASVISGSCQRDNTANGVAERGSSTGYVSTHIYVVGKEIKFQDAVSFGQSRRHINYYRVSGTSGHNYNTFSLNLWD